MTLSARRTLLVTRPEPGLSDTLAQLRSLGWIGMACPVIAIHLQTVLPALDSKAIAITSAHALPALQNQPKEMLLLTVGEKTAHRARQVGFKYVLAAEGTRDSLQALCRAQGLDGKDITFVCGRGEQGQAYSDSVAHHLGAQWMEGYRVTYAMSLPKDVEQALDNGEVYGVVFYSSETARSFIKLCSSTVEERLSRVRAVCLSNNIAACIRSIAWRDIVIGPPLEMLGKI